MNLELHETTPPSLVDLAEGELGVTKHALPSTETALRSALLGETLRIGLFSLFSRSGAPVHELSLRAWLERKLSSLFDSLDQSEERDYRQVLLGSRGQNLELAGDALILPGGFVCPAPSRAIRVSEQSVVLLSGLPSHLLPNLRPHLAFTSLGRRIEGVDSSELSRLGIRSQTVDSYLGTPDTVTVSSRLHELTARQPESAWFGGGDWEAYIGNQQAGAGHPIPAYGFLWSRTTGRSAHPPLEVDLGSNRISLWRQPITSRFYRFWLRVTSSRGSSATSVPLTDWKLIALALDAESGRPRVALLVRNVHEKSVTLSVGFPPYWRLYRLVNLLGGELTGRRGGEDVWRFPLTSGSLIKDLLESDGVTVTTRE